MFKWRSYVIFESCNRAVHKTTIKMGMIEICFYCLFTHIRDQPKYNRCVGKCARWATHVHCKDGRVLSKHAKRKVYVSENFVEFRHFFHVYDRHGLALVTMATQKATRTIFFTFAHWNITLSIAKQIQPPSILTAELCGHLCKILWLLGYCC